MKKFTLISFILAMIIHYPLGAQENSARAVKIVTDPIDGERTEFIRNAVQVDLDTYFFEARSKEVEINWQFTDPAAVGSKVKVSASAGFTFSSWWLNDERVSLYGGSASPVWESTVDTDWEWPIDMTEDGAWAASGYDSVVHVYSTSTSAIYWETIISGSVLGVKLNPDGSKVYIAENKAGNSNVYCFTVGQNTADWTTSFNGGGTVFTGSNDGSKLVFCQYTGVNKMWVIDSENGEIVFDAFYKNQNPPGISHDGSVIVNGDYSGNVHLFYYNESENAYIEKWDYKVGGGGSSVWVVGMAVSGDGSTVAVGTLIFTTSGGYDGEIYLFNSWSPVPLWIFQNAGDEICSIDFTEDGSLMAAAGWGPINHSKPDFYLFRKESPNPIFSINTLGSFFSVDLSDNGTLCAVAGKAVHAREFGNGGLLYNVDSDPDGGTLSGLVDLENTDDESNVKIEINDLDYYYALSSQTGDYEIKYIPEGTYSVTASKIGYYPETVDNVVISEGETTTLDFVLEETGNPPLNLSATKGAGLTIDLNWEYSDPQSVLGFNIYRKFIQEDLFPEEPIAILSNSELSFEDIDVIPLRHYYYAVTAIIEAEVESPYSNVAEGWMAEGYITDEISIYIGTTPVIDGEISPGEWDDAFVLDASDFLGKNDNTPNPVGSVVMFYKMNQEMTELYVGCINLNDTVLEDHDEVALYIDDNNDGEYPEVGDNSEGNYWAAYYAAGNEIRYRPIYNTGGVGEIINLEDPQIEVSDDLGYIVYEFMIPIGDDADWKINPNTENESGLFSFTLDDPTAFDGYWPCDNPEIFIPLDYGVMIFGAEDLVPPPPQDLELSWTYDTQANITLEWSYPEINDFSHFKVYKSVNSADWELLESTIGRQIFYSTSVDFMQFYVTTVDHAEQESEPSEIVTYDVISGTDDSDHKIIEKIFPNPFGHQLNIYLDIRKTQAMNISVLSLDGRKIKTLWTGKVEAGSKKIHWDGNTDQGKSCDNGLYLIAIEGEEVTETARIVLMR
jgi:hypothetical protein